METIGRILRVQFLAGNRLRRSFDKHGIDWSGFDVLATLRRSGPPYRMTPTHLYRELVLTSGAMTHRMDALERAGLIERRPDPNDRRSMMAALTRRGRQLIDRALVDHLAAEAEIEADLTRSERAELALLLKKLLLGMEAGK
jgi:DNA-binding MarR family transcriptional regulator